MKLLPLFAVLVIALVLRLLVANQPFQEDEFHWAGGIAVSDWLGVASRNSPLSFAVFQANAAVVGESSIVLLRLPFILVGLATIAAVYFFARKRYGNKTAMIASVLLAISPHHVLASTQATYEGSFFTLFFFLALASVLNRSYAWTGFFFGFALLSKTSAIVLLPLLIFVLVFYQAGLRKAFRTTMRSVLVGTGMFFVGFGIPSIITHSPALINAIAQLLSLTGLRRENLLLLGIQYAYALIWIGPLFLFLPFFAVFKKNIHFLTVIGFVVFFYTVIVKDNFPPIERYMMILLPFLAILAAQECERICLDKKVKVYGCFFVCLTILIGIALNLGTDKHIPFSNKSVFVTQAVHVQNFLLPISGSSGPIGFYIPFAFVSVVFATTAFLALYALVSKQKQLLSIVFIISVSLGFNVLFFMEYATGFFHGSIPEASNALVTFANKEVLPVPVYFLRNYALQYHLSPQYKMHPASKEKQLFNYARFEAYRNYNATRQIRQATLLALDKKVRTLSFAEDTHSAVTALAEDVKKEGGTFFIVDFPHINKDGPLFSFLKMCSQEHPHKFAYVFRCSPSSS